MNFFNGIIEDNEQLEDNDLSNIEMMPITKSNRTWSMLDIAALWVGISVCIPTYMLASGLISQGMNWWQAIVTIFLGNLIVLVPMVLNAHAGTKYGISFPVFSRAAFGLNGTHIPGILRAIVACGWFGIQTWIGGAAIHQILSALIPAWKSLPIIDLGFIGSASLGAWLGFIIFWIVNIVIILRGIETIRWLEKCAAPFLIMIGVTLMTWAVLRAGGFGPILTQPSKFTTTSEFFAIFFPALTGMVGYWATLSLNIPDFTRYVKTQKDQIYGQALGLNITMPFYSFVGVVVTSATVIIFGREIWDPVEVMSQFKNPIIVVVSMTAIWIATLSTNLAANVVAPANSFSNLLPKKISFKMGGIITGIIGILIMPWKLLSDPTGYIFTWLIGYSGLLGPIGGIMIADYYVIKKMNLNIQSLYSKKGEYFYFHGFNLAAIIALIIPISLNLPGFLVEIKIITATNKIIEFLHQCYFYSWFIGFILAFVLYIILMNVRKNKSVF